MNIGLYFGSFNPIHIGHLIVANSLLEIVDLEEIWLVVSPANPLKNTADLADENHRLQMVEVAIADHPCLKACDIEFDMPKPSYTIDTLKKLRQAYPNNTYSIIMGSDNLIHFDQWKSPEDILQTGKVHVYARHTAEAIPEKWLKHSAFQFHDLPLIDVSSTMLRKKIKDGQSIRYWVRDEVEEYINENEVY